MKITGLMYKGYGTIMKNSGSSYYGILEGIDDLVTFQSDSESGFEEEFHRAVDDYLKACECAGKEPGIPYRKELKELSSEMNQEVTEKIIVGHDYGAAVWLRAVLLDYSEVIDQDAVHELEKEVSVELELFEDEFEDIFLEHFDPELEVNKKRFTRAFSDEGRYLTGFEKNILEPNFFTPDSILRIADELEKRGREYDLQLAHLLKDIVDAAPRESYISVMS